MIKILFPPGCYGTYFSRCLYNYTDLSSHRETNFEFCDDGSSHLFRDDHESKKLIWYGHCEDTVLTEQDTVITITPVHDHCLDYYNNQFVKWEKSNLISYLRTQIINAEIKLKLSQNWDYKFNTLNEDIPRWILREWVSFWIVDVWKTIDSYKQIKSSFKLDTQDIFENIFEKLVECAKIVDKKLTADIDTIMNNQKKFIKAQQFHNSQIRCQQWVDQILNSQFDHPSPCITIFDESYVQYLLREQKFEIQCDQLNIFPLTSLDMKKIIYKI